MVGTTLAGPLTRSGNAGNQPGLPRPNEIRPPTGPWSGGKGSRTSHAMARCVKQGASAGPDRRGDAGAGGSGGIPLTPTESLLPEFDWQPRSIRFVHPNPDRENRIALRPSGCGGDLGLPPRTLARSSDGQIPSQNLVAPTSRDVNRGPESESQTGPGPRVPVGRPSKRAFARVPEGDRVGADCRNPTRG